MKDYLNGLSAITRR